MGNKYLYNNKFSKWPINCNYFTEGDILKYQMTGCKFILNAPQSYHMYIQKSKQVQVQIDISAPLITDFYIIYIKQSV